RLQPLQHVSRPGVFDLLRTGAWRSLPFLWRTLGTILARTGLPRPVVDAVSIWTHVAGQRLDEAPGPLAFVPAGVHTVGAYYPTEGMGAIPGVLADEAEAAGASLRYGVKVKAIHCRNGRVVGVETDQGEWMPADAVVSNAAGVGTYLDLVDASPARERER